MQIEMVKDPFNFKRFKVILDFEVNGGILE